MIKMKKFNNTFKVTTLSLAVALLAGCNDDDDTAPPAQRSNQTVNILAFNDFHGNLEPPKVMSRHQIQMMLLNLFVFLWVE